MTVVLITNNAQLISAVREALAPTEFEVRAIRNRMDVPLKADVLVTKATPNKRIELLAGGMGCYPVCLPEAADFLARKVREGQWSVLAGADCDELKL